MRHRLAIVMLLGVVTLFFGSFAAQIRFDNTIESYFLEDDLEDYDRFLDAFGTDEIVVVSFVDADIFTVQNFELIDRISRKLEGLPHVRRVLSLTSADIVFAAGGSVNFESLTPALPSGREELESIRKRAFADPIIRGTLISADARATAIVAEIDRLIRSFDYKVDLLKRIRGFLADLEDQTGTRFAIAGTSVLDDALFHHTERDQEQFFPFMIGIILSVMYLMFHRLVMALLPFAVVILSLVWTYGFMSLLGYKINVISTVIGPLLMAVAIADSMHVLSEYVQRAAAEDATPLESIERSFHAVLAPCVMTTVTTILGLLSLLSADLVPVRQFGLVAAVGVFSALVVTVLLLPILLSVIPADWVVRRASVGTGSFSGLLGYLGQWRRGRAMVILAISSLAVLPAVFSWTRVTVGTNSLDYFRKDDPVRVATEWIDENLAGTTSLEFLIDAPSAPGVLDPALLGKMERFQDYLLSSQMKSFGLAFIVIGLAMLIAFRSWRLGLLAMIPNFLPVLFVVGLMPVLGIALDVGTVMIASVALGLIVDDTIHFLYRFKVEAGRTGDVRSAIARAIQTAGRPIIYTSVVLALGFVVLVFASFNPVIHFGILATIVILLALAFDLVVLPAVMGLVWIGNRR
jgi:predicted RND superfamily exporter protein